MWTCLPVSQTINPRFVAGKGGKRFPGSDIATWERQRTANPISGSTYTGEPITNHFVLLGLRSKPQLFYVPRRLLMLLTSGLLDAGNLKANPHAANKVDGTKGKRFTITRVATSCADQSYGMEAISKMNWRDCTSSMQKVYLDP